MTVNGFLRCSPNSRRFIDIDAAPVIYIAVAYRREAPIDDLNKKKLSLIRSNESPRILWALLKSMISFGEIETDSVTVRSQQSQTNHGKSRAEEVSLVGNRIWTPEER